MMNNIDIYTALEEIEVECDVHFSCCRAIKRVSFTSNYLTLVCQSRNVLLFQRVSQSKAIIFQSNASSTVLKNTRVNGCFFIANYF